jgi:hypothetical protein
MWEVPLCNIAVPCREEVLLAVACNEAPSDLALDNWQSSGQVCAAASAGFQLLARYQG